MLSSILLRNLSFSALFSVVLSSDITTYSDGKCKKSFDNLDAINGYPDGVCTPLELGGDRQTFQIAKLDPGCAVTLYGPNSNSLSCSSELKIVAEFATCYNSSWVYYSIDGCLEPSSSTIVLPTATSKPSASASPNSPATPKSNHTGVIVGGVVSGVSVFAVAFGIALFCLKRRRSKPLPPPPEYELSNEHARMELSYPEKTHQEELYAHEAAIEIGRNSIHVPPVELPGDALVGEDKKGLDPLRKIHTVH